MPSKSKSKAPKAKAPQHKFVRTPAIRLATAVRIITREAAEYRASLDEANALKARYERAKA